MFGYLTYIQKADSWNSIEADEFPFRHVGMSNFVQITLSKIDGKFDWRKRMMMSRDDQLFIGYRFLVIEDEPLIAILIADMIEDMGGTVAAVEHRTETALRAIREIPVDCATLDVNLSGELSFPLAVLLKQAQIPFAFCTAYSDLAIFPKSFTAPRIMKPFEVKVLRDVLASLLRL